MESLYFDDVNDFVELIDSEYVDLINSDGIDSDVIVLGHFDDIRDIASGLCTYGYMIHSVSGLVDTEKDEFVLAILHHEIWIEPAKFNDAYKRIGGDVVFVLSDCNSALLKRIMPGATVYEANIDHYDDCDGDCENCSSYDLENTDESYSINGKSVSKEEYDEKIAKLDGIYQNHIKRVMTDWVNFYDDMEQWRKLLDW